MSAGQGVSDALGRRVAKLPSASDSGLIGHWRFDESAGTTAIYTNVSMKFLQGAARQDASQRDGGTASCRLSAWRRAASMSTMQLTARIWPEEDAFVAECVELRVVSQGNSEEIALENLREAVELFLEHADSSEVNERMHEGMHVRTFDVPA